MAVLLLSTVPARAESTLSITAEDGIQGTEITAEVELRENTGFSALEFEIEYDKDQLEWVSVKSTGLLPGGEALNGPHMSFVDPAEGGNQSTGTVAVLRFQIREDAAAGPAEISIRTLNSYQADLSENPVHTEAATFTIFCRKHELSEKETVLRAPTCLISGTGERQCTVCGATVQTVIPSLSHDFGEMEILKEAGEGTEGLGVRTCSLCGRKKQEVIPAILVETDETEETVTEKETEGFGSRIRDTWSHVSGKIRDCMQDAVTVSLPLLIGICVIGAAFAAAIILLSVRLKKLQKAQKSDSVEQIEIPAAGIPEAEVMVPLEVTENSEVIDTTELKG